MGISGPTIDKNAGGSDAAVLNMLMHDQNQASGGSSNGDYLFSISVNNPVELVNISNTVWIAAYKKGSGYPCLRVITRSGDTLSVGAEYVLVSSSKVVRGLFRHPTDTDKVVVFYDDQAVVATLSGTSFISKGTVFTSSYAGNTPDGLWKAPDNTFYMFDINGTNCYFDQITVSDTTISSSATGNFTVASGTTVVGIVDNDRAFYGYASGKYVHTQIMSITGSTFSTTGMPSTDFYAQNQTSHQIAASSSHGNGRAWVSLFENGDATVGYNSIVEDTSQNAYFAFICYYDKSEETLTRIVPYTENAGGSGTTTYAFQGGMFQLGYYSSNSYRPILVNAGVEGRGVPSPWGACMFSSQYYNGFQFWYAKLTKGANGAGIVSQRMADLWNGSGGDKEESKSIAVNEALDYAVFTYAYNTGIYGMTIKSGDA